jgi:hypothetical protein
MNLKLEEKASQEDVSPQAPMHVLKMTPFDVLLQGDGIASCLSPAINYDLLIDCVRKYPEYQGYFSEKLEKLAELEDKILNPKLRGAGETKTFLKQWKTHFIKQIEFMIDHLKKDKPNG